MAKRSPSFNFGANANKPKKAKAKKARKTTGKARGGKSNAWRAYVGDNSPIPD